MTSLRRSAGISSAVIGLPGEEKRSLPENLLLLFEDSHLASQAPKLEVFFTRQTALLNI